MSAGPSHPPVVYVEWSDAAQLNGGWDDRQRVLEDAAKFSKPICAAGFMLQDGPDYIVLAGAYNSHNDDAAHGFLIPRSEISRLVHLRKARGMEKERPSEE
jgi:hypothetical protein